MTPDTDTPVESFFAAYRSMFSDHYSIGRASAPEWQAQILDKFTLVKATEALRRLSMREGGSPTIADVRREVWAAMPRRTDSGPKLNCACCHGDGGYMTFGALHESKDYPSSIAIVAVCGFAGWCPDISGEPSVFPRKEGVLVLPAVSCALHGSTRYQCSKAGVACKCSVGEMKMQSQIAKGIIEDVPRYERLRDMVHSEIRRRLAWESGREDKPIKLDISIASATSLAMIKKFA